MPPVDIEVGDAFQAGRDAISETSLQADQLPLRSLTLFEFLSVAHLHVFVGAGPYLDQTVHEPGELIC